MPSWCIQVRDPNDCHQTSIVANKLLLLNSFGLRFPASSRRNSEVASGQRCSERSERSVQAQMAEVVVTVFAVQWEDPMEVSNSRTAAHASTCT